MNAVFPLWSDCPPLPVIDSGPNSSMLLARSGTRRAKHEESRRVLGPAGPHFSRPANQFRNAVAVSRSESFVSVCVQGTIRIVNCAPTEIHMKDQETHATTICFVNQVNFPMLLKLRVAPGSINHPLSLKNMSRFYSHGGVQHIVSILRAPKKVDVTCHGFRAVNTPSGEQFAKPPKTFGPQDFL